ncbi:MAG: aldehyde dehydrogenase, partial [Rhodocyclales bacterium CG_4_9_14_3_um_filter_68_10]
MARQRIMKTYKLYIGGKFPRSESGRSIEVVESKKEAVIAHLCRASRKDLRDAVEAARQAQPAWVARDAYNRGQILYRMAEMMEGKNEEFAEAIASTVPGGKRRAKREVSAAIDRLVHYAG